MRSRNLCFVVGARPNFVKAAPVVNSVMTAPARFHCRLVHTGQHYDRELSDLFFRDLGIPQPDVSLGVGSGSHAQQTARVMVQLEEILEKKRPDLLIVFGDVNSTLAAALVAAKLQIPLAHVESGLRSFDPAMPEEVNRRVTDCLSDLLFVTEASGVANLIDEGVSKERIHLVGNTMVDSLFAHLPRAREKQPRLLSTLGLESSRYAVLTMHRPANVDGVQSLLDLLTPIAELSSELPVIFPLHPRTRKKLADESSLSDLLREHPAMNPIAPLGYLDFLALLDGARIVLTDSGGIQEETTALGIPCITLRDNTERPATLTEGTNHLAGRSSEGIRSTIDSVLTSPWNRSDQRRPNLWDGQAASRILEILDRGEWPRAGGPRGSR